MIYYIELSGSNIIRATVKQEEGLVKIDTGDQPLPPTLNSYYKWDGQAWVYTPPEADIITFMKELVAAGKLTIDELYILAKGIYLDFNVLTEIIKMKSDG
jgi:hypothetical protein